MICEHSVLIKPYTIADDTDELVSYKDDAMAVHGIKLEELETNGIEQVDSHRALSDCYSTFGLARILKEKGIFKID